jgi:uncharacterized protein
MSTSEPVVAAAARLLAAEGGLPEAESVVHAGRLRFQHCPVCGYVRYPVAPRCPECLTPGGIWVFDSGLGTVWSSCVYHRAYNPAFAETLPYAVVLVELDSGPRLISNVLHGDNTAPSVGLRVQASPRQVDGDRWLVYFEPLTERPQVQSQQEGIS